MPAQLGLERLDYLIHRGIGLLKHREELGCYSLTASCCQTCKVKMRSDQNSTFFSYRVIFYFLQFSTPPFSSFFLCALFSLRKGVRYIILPFIIYQPFSLSLDSGFPVGHFAPAPDTSLPERRGKKEKKEKENPASLGPFVYSVQCPYFFLESLLGVYQYWMRKSDPLTEICAEVQMTLTWLRLSTTNVQ